VRGRPLLLVAAGGLGREVAAAVSAMDEFELLGYVDDEPSTWGTVPGGALVLGPLSVIAQHPDAAVVVCAGHGRDRVRLTERLVGDGVDPSRFASVVDPTVRMGPDVVVGAGSVVLAGCVLTTGVTVGAGCVVMPNVTLTHDVVLEDHATVAANAALAGAVIVGRQAYVGMGATVRQDVTLGRGCTVGMGAVVVADVPDDETWAGVPARRVATRMEVR
jgi:sugar O-acyltransferase (sialic acid O-acetyltransferase NeuD family)